MVEKMEGFLINFRRDDKIERKKGVQKIELLFISI
jgi:hypothetical protein